jgi:hypothetical protein
MTIKEIGETIIELIRTFPDEARQSQAESGPLTSWDEYKEQMQYEEYDSFEVFQHTIENLVETEISEITEDEVLQLYNQCCSRGHRIDISEMREVLKTRVVSYIDEEASDQDIEYRKPEMEFIRYFEDDLIIVAEVMKQVGPDDFLIQAYSEATGHEGEQGQVDITTLDEENHLERISHEEFMREKWILTELNKDDDDLTEIQRAIKKMDYSLYQYRSLSDSESNTFKSELFQSGMIISNCHIMRGATGFDEFVKAMVKDLGYSVKPYLKSFYGLLRNWPEIKSTGMDSPEEIEKANIDEILL